MRALLSRGLVVIWLWIPTVAAAAPEDFLGSWMLTIEAPGVVPYIARLDIELDGTGRPVAYVENGPAPITINHEYVELRIDARDRQGYRFVRALSGRLVDDVLSGTLATEDILETAAENGEDGSAWHAERLDKGDARDSSQYTLADYEGTWVPHRGVDLRKYSMALTEQGLAWTGEYDARLDEPQKRCVSPGLAAVATWMFPFELIVREERQRLTLLYEAFSQMRRVYLAGPEPEFFPESSMGYSRGRFADGELEIETRYLSARTRDFNGEPVGENARIVEQYFLTEDGARLNMVMTLNDPDNYQRPPIRRRAWYRNEEATVLPFECDPDSFFRQLYSEGRMQEYIDRAYMRP